MAEILIVEDDIALNEGLKFALEKDGYKVESVFTGKDALTSINKQQALVLLDVNLPDSSGFQIAEKITGTPIIFLTAKDTEADMLKGFALGCEDYITKPFSLPVLKEKIKVVLRRRDAQNSELYAYNTLSYDNNKKQLTIGESSIPLTKREHKIIEYLIINKEQVITKGQLLEHIWDKGGDFVSENTVNVNINRLRNKIEDNPSKPKWIKTVFGIGYKWSEHHEDK